jgi:hypothetical protein
MWKTDREETRSAFANQTIQTPPLPLQKDVFASALLFGATPGKLIPPWKSAKIQPHLVREIVAELLRVSTYPGFGLSENEIQFLTNALIF